MIINKKITKLENGEYEAVWSLSEDQVNFLISYAINYLLSIGAAEIVETEQQDVLSGIDVQDMPRA